jgi:hypothetical protein
VIVSIIPLDSSCTPNGRVYSSPPPPLLPKLKSENGQSLPLCVATSRPLHYYRPLWENKSCQKLNEIGRRRAATPVIGPNYDVIAFNQCALLALCVPFRQNSVAMKLASKRQLSPINRLRTTAGLTSTLPDLDPTCRMKRSRHSCSRYRLDKEMTTRRRAQRGGEQAIKRGTACLDDNASGRR